MDMSEKFHEELRETMFRCEKLKIQEKGTSVREQFHTYFGRDEYTEVENWLQMIHMQRLNLKLSSVTRIRFQSNVPNVTLHQVRKSFQQRLMIELTNDYSSEKRKGRAC